MATVSLRVAHQLICPNKNRSSLDSAKQAAGCRCKPTYFTFYRDKGGRPIKGARVRSRREAERSAHSLQADLDAGRLLRRESNIDFAEWADRWLDQHRAKENTLRLYRHSLAVAKRAFRGLTVREIANSDISRFLELLQKDGEARGRSPTSTTLNKHFRNLHACLEAAVPEYVPRTPLTTSTRHCDRERRATSQFFGNEELVRLWESFAARDDHLGLYLSKTAVTTGLRLGSCWHSRAATSTWPGRC